MLRPEQIAAALDGSPRVELSGVPTRQDLGHELWVARLYGYRFESYRPSAPRSGVPPVLTLVLDQDPLARRRAAWMRAPDLRPGADSPVEWAWLTAGQWLPNLWTPPGWPPGAYPVPPTPEQLPSAPADVVSDRLSPYPLVALSLVLGTFSGTAASQESSVLAAVLGALAVAAALGAWQVARMRERALRRSFGRPAPTRPPGGTQPPPPPPTLRDQGGDQSSDPEGKQR